MRFTALALGLILSSSVSATTYIDNGDGTTTAIHCSDSGVTTCSAKTYENDSMDSAAAIAVVAILAAAGLTAWYLLANYQGAYVMPMTDIDTNGVKTIGFKIEKSF